MILVTDWEKVEKDDFYLSDDWLRDDADGVERARVLQEQGKLFVAYIVNAVDYAVYYKMECSKVFIDDDCDRVLLCESDIIGNDHQHREKFEE